jgi:molybdate transport system regulatory protein
MERRCAQPCEDRPGMSRDDTPPHRRPPPRHPSPRHPSPRRVRTPPAAPDPLVCPRIRVLYGKEIALGPGKVALLQAIQAGGSLTAAARGLGMSYMRAWKLVQTMNACFREPLVTTRRGGKIHGSAVLTKTGERVLALYRGMEEASRQVMAASWQELRTLLL